MQQEISNRKNVYVCPSLSCNMKFKSKDILDKHILKHSEKKSFTCEVCSKTYSRKSYLSAHMKCHSEDNPFKCEECDLRFADKCGLQRHWRMHKGVKLYVCELCNKKLSSLRTLKEHRLCHTGEKPHSCEICNRGFATSRKLNSHRRALHENKKQFSFQICEESLLEVDVDCSRIHSENCKKCQYPFVCEICNRRCKTDVDLANHKHFHEREKNRNSESEMDTLCRENSAVHVVTYSQFMRKNVNTYGKRCRSAADDND